MADNTVTIVVAAVVAFLLITVLGGIVYCRLKYGNKKSEPTAPHKLDAIMPEGKWKKSITNPHLAGELERAQKFRERAKSVSIGRPEFKLSRKSHSVSHVGDQISELLQSQQYQSQLKPGSDSINPHYQELTSLYSQQPGTADIENQQNNNSNNNNSNKLPPLDPDYIEQKQNYQYNRINSLRNMRSNSYRLSVDGDNGSRKNSGTAAPDTAATETQQSQPSSPMKPIISQPQAPRQTQYSPPPPMNSSSPRSTRSQVGIAAQNSDNSNNNNDEHEQFISNTAKSSPTVEYNDQHKTSGKSDGDQHHDDPDRSDATELKEEGAMTPKRSPRPNNSTVYTGDSNNMQLESQ